MGFLGKLLKALFKGGKKGAKKRKDVLSRTGPPRKKR